MAEKKGNGKDQTIKKFKADDEDSAYLGDETGPLFEFEVDKPGDKSPVLGQGAKPAGIGPDCSPGEKGEGEKVACMFNANRKCLAEYYDTIVECLIANKDPKPGGYARIEVAEKIPSQAPVVTCEANADKRKEECKKRSKHDCTCNSSIFEFCIDPNGCDPLDPDEDDPVDDPDPPTDPDDPGTWNGPVGPRLTRVSVLNSAYGIPVPVVWGRYIVGGNMFWMSDLKTATYTSVDRPDASLSEKENTATVKKLYFDMAVGMCRGPANALVRIWMGDQLIYSGALPTDGAGVVLDVEASSVYNLAALMPGDRSYINLGKIVPRFTLYGGGPNQKRNPKMSYAQGAQVTPAYRELAYVMVEDLNIALLNGSFPAFRFEVYNASEETTGIPRQFLANLDDAPPVDEDLNNVSRDFLALDVSRGTLYATGHNDPTGEDGLKLIDYSQMTEKTTVLPHGYDFTSYNTFVMKSGVVFGQGSDYPQEVSRVYDPRKDLVLDEYGASNSNAGHQPFYTYGIVGVPGRGSAMSSMLTYDRDEIPREAVLITAGGYDDFHVAFYDPATRTFGRQGSWYEGNTNAPFDECYDDCNTPCVDDCIANCAEDVDPPLCETFCVPGCDVTCTSVCDSGNGTTLATVPSYLDSPTSRAEGWHVLTGSPEGTTSSISVSWVELHNSATSRKFNSSLFPSAMGSIDSVHYGGQTSQVTVPMAYQSLNGEYLIILIRTLDQSFIVKWDSANAVVDYSFAIPQYPEWGSSNHRRIPYIDEAGFVYISEDNDVVSVDLLNARTSLLFNLADFDGTDGELPLLDGAQLFDPREQSLTYICVGEFSPRSIIKIFPTRVAASPTSLAKIVSGVCEISGVSSDRIDVTEIEDINIIGYAINSVNTGTDMLRQLAEFFSVRVYDRGDRMMFRLPAEEADVILLDYADLAVTARDAQVSLQHTRRDSTGAVTGVELTVADIDNFCDDKKVKFSLDADVTDQDDQRLAKREGPIVLDDAETVNAALRIIHEINLNSSEFVFGFGPKHHALTPGDVVQITTPDGVVYTSLLRSTITGATLTSKLQGIEYLLSARDTYTPAADIHTKRGAKTSTGTALEGARVYPIFVPSILDDHRVDDQWLVYAGIDVAGDEFTRTYQPIMALQQSAAAVGKGFVDSTTLREQRPLGVFRPSFSKPAYIGTLLTPPNAVTNPLTTDTVSQMVIRFDRPHVVSRFVSGLNNIDLIEDITKNLLIVGRELIQFRDWTVGIDGRTVTFSHLLRGRNGTDCYASYHPIQDAAFGETRDVCFLYTEDTIQASYHPASMATLFANVLASESIPAFTADENIPSKYYAPGDSSRFWGPGDISRFDAAHASNATRWDITFRWKRRSIRTLNEVDTTSVPLENEVETYQLILVSGAFNSPLDVRAFERALMNPSVGGSSFLRFASGPLTAPEYVLSAGSQASLGLFTGSSTFYVVVVQERSVGDTNVYGLPGYSIFRPDRAYPLP